MLKKKIVRVGIYIRVSTLEQAMEGYSLGEQEERLRDYCKARGWNVADVYIDGGFSGSNIERPALHKLLNDIKFNKLDLVLVYKLDRLSRSQKDTLFLIEDVFTKHGVDFVSMSENFDTSTPFGKAMIGILSVFAQLEREQIKERMTLGRIARAKDGYFHGGANIPIGYDYINGELVINNYEAMQVRKVYDLFLKGYPVARIRKIMNSSYTTKYGGWESDSTIKSCLTTPIYYGMITFKGELYDGRHEPIVSKELFDKVQARLEELDKNKTQYNKTPFKHSYLLSGAIWCGNCGARYYTHHVNPRKNSTVVEGWNYYSCYSRTKSNKRMVVDPTCKNKTWNVKVADKLVIDEILKLKFNKGYIEELIANSQNDKEDDNANEIKVLEGELFKVTKQIDKLMDLYQLDDVPLDNIAKRLEALNNERNRLEYELSKMDYSKVKETKLSISETKEIVKDAKTILESDDMDAKRMLVHSLIEKIEFYNDHIKIYWAFC